MKFKKIVFNYDIEDVIKSNLSLQSISRTLESDFGFKNLEFNNVIDKGVRYYQTWPQDKKDRFIKTIGGKANFKKTKAYLESKLGE